MGENKRLEWGLVNNKRPEVRVKWYPDIEWGMGGERRDRELVANHKAHPSFGHRFGAEILFDSDRGTGEGDQQGTSPTPDTFG